MNLEEAYEHSRLISPTGILLDDDGNELRDDDGITIIPEENRKDFKILCNHEISVLDLVNVNYLSFDEAEIKTNEVCEACGKLMETSVKVYKR